MGSLKKHSEESKKKISLSLKGNQYALGKHWKLSDETKLKMSRSRLGVPSPKIKGEKNSHWRGGVTPINKSIRMSAEYNLWRKSVYERDGYACIWCGVKGNGKNLNADHIKPFADYPELRFAIDNGRTLCIDCHKKTDTYGWRGYHNRKL